MLHYHFICRRGLLWHEYYSCTHLPLSTLNILFTLIYVSSRCFWCSYRFRMLWIRLLNHCQNDIVFRESHYVTGKFNGIFFLNVLADTCVLFWPHWYLYFGFLVTSPLGFKARAGSEFCRGKCNVHSLRSTSDAIPAHHLATGIAASHFPTCISRGGTWLGFEWAITWTEDKRTTIVPATWLSSMTFTFNKRCKNGKLVE